MPPKMAWATQVDTEEAEGAAALPALPATFKAAGKAPESYPSLGDAAKVVETKAEKKKKAQKMSLAEFRCTQSSHFLQRKVRSILSTQ